MKKLIWTTVALIAFGSFLVSDTALGLLALAVGAALLISNPYGVILPIED